jgi:hypothetical protein
MRTLSMIAMLLLTLSQAPAPTGSIQGSVEQGSTKAGIAEVQISVTFQPPINRSAPAPQQGAFPAQQVVATLQTDASGHFELKNLAVGTYIIQAQREGFTAGVNQFSGVARPTATDATTVVADQTSKVTLSMTRGATISGRIIDAKGNSVPNITVAAFQREYQDGRAVLLSVLTKQTDDRGEYRLFWLNPGEYYIGVLPGAGVGAFAARGGAAAGPGVSHPSFYPGVLDARTATRVKVDEGAEVNGIGIGLQAIPGGVTVSGTVDNSLPNIPAGPRGQPPNLGARQFYLIPLDSTALTQSNTAAIRGGARGGVGTSYQIGGVLPGSYDLIAVVADDQGRPFPGRTRIDVGNQDLTGVTIPVHPGVEVKGHITLSGTGTAAVPLQFLRVQLRPADGTPAIAVNVLNQGARGARGQIGGVIPPADPSLFSYPNVPDGRYNVQVLPLPASAYIEDIREGTRSIYDSGLTIESGKAPGEIQILINSDGERLEGTVLDTAQKAVVAHVVLVPAPSRRQNASLYKTATSNANGKFTMIGVAPGDYKLFAWEDVPNGAWQNAEFMTNYEVLGTAVKVAPGIRNDIQLRVIPAGK